MASGLPANPYIPVTAKLLEILSEGYTAPCETAAIVPRSKRAIFETNIIIIINIS